MRPLLLIGSTLLLLAACSAPAGEDDPSSGSDAISHEEAAKNLDFPASLVASNLPVGADVQEKLGIRTWAVYSIAKDGMLGAVAFAIDQNGDVKYAVSVVQDDESRSGAGDEPTATGAIVAYDKKGVDEKIKVSADDYNLVLRDFARMRDALSDSASSSGGISAKALSKETKECAKFVGVILLGLVVTTGAGAVALSTGVASATTSVAAEILLSGGAAGAGTGVVVGGMTLMMSKKLTAWATNGIDSCDRAASKEKK